MGCLHGPAKNLISGLTVDLMTNGQGPSSALGWVCKMQWICSSRGSSSILIRSFSILATKSFGNFWEQGCLQTLWYFQRSDVVSYLLPYLSHHTCQRLVLYGHGFLSPGG